MPKAAFVSAKIGESESRLGVGRALKGVALARTAPSVSFAPRNADAGAEADSQSETGTASRSYFWRALGPALLTIQLDGTVSDWSRAAERLSGHAARNVLGQPLSSFLELDSEELMFVADRSDGRDMVELDGRLARADHSWRAVIVCLAAVRDETGLLVSLRVRLRDVSHSDERVSRNLEIKRLRASADATAGLAHDVNNLLMVIQAYAEFVAAGSLS